MELDSKTVVAELERIFEADGSIGSMPPDAIKQSGELHPAVVKQLKQLHAMQNDIVDGKSDDYQGLHKHVVNTMSLAKKHGHHDIVGDLDAIKKVALKHDAIKRKGTAKSALATPDVPQKSAGPEELPSSDLEDEPEPPAGSKSDLGVSPASHKSVQSVDPKLKLKANPRFDWGSGGDEKASGPPPLDKAKKAQSDAKGAKLKDLKRAQDPESSKIDKAVDTMRNAFANDSNYKNSRSGAKYNPAHDKAAIQKAAPATNPGDHGIARTTSKGGFSAKVLAPGEKPKAPPVSAPPVASKPPVGLKKKVSPVPPKV